MSSRVPIIAINKGNPNTLQGEAFIYIEKEIIDMVGEGKVDGVEGLEGQEVKDGDGAEDRENEKENSKLEKRFKLVSEKAYFESTEMQKEVCQKVDRFEKYRKETNCPEKKWCPKQ